jgi:hypothetical protein
MVMEEVRSSNLWGSEFVSPSDRCKNLKEQHNRTFQRDLLRDLQGGWRIIVK